MHEDTTNAILQRLFSADRVIHEQLLGLSWEPPAAVTMIDPAAKGACRAFDLPLSLRLRCTILRFTSFQLSRSACVQVFHALLVICSRVLGLCAAGVAEGEEKASAPAGSGDGLGDGLAAAIEAGKAAERSERVRVMLEVCVLACTQVSRAQPSSLLHVQPMLAFPSSCADHSTALCAAP